MLLDPKIKIIEVSLQGTLHAVVPVTSNNRVIAYKDAPEKRLNRALRQMEKEYGLKLSFTPDKPRKDYGGNIKSVMIEVDEVIEKYKNDDCPRGHSKEKGCRCHIGDKPTTIEEWSDNALPKCTASESTKRIYLNCLKIDPNTGHEGKADLWLDISKIEENIDACLYQINCPFCSEKLNYSDWWASKKRKDPIARYKEVYKEYSAGKVLCEPCHISFKWDFDKNIVVMRNERTE